MTRRELHELLGTRWALGISFALASGPPLRFGAIRSACPGISNRILAKALRALIAAGLAAREGAFYGITELGVRVLGWSGLVIVGVEDVAAVPDQPESAVG